MGLHDVGLQVDRLCMVCMLVLVWVRTNQRLEVGEGDRSQPRGKVVGAPNRSAGAIAWTPVAL